MRKYSLITVSIIVILSTLLVFNAYSQEIPNNSFENWAVAAEGHEDPVSWGTANSTTNVFPINKITTEKTTDSYEGEFAAMLTSKTVLTFVAPGFITLGQFSIDLFTQVTSITGGIEFSLHPDRLKLWYKYTPAENDSFRIGLWMLRDDGSEIPDTVATAIHNESQTISDYTELVIDIDYRSELTPEILNVIAVSSNPDNPVAGSILYVDKFELEYNTGILSNTDSNFSIFPSPATDFIYINDFFSSDNYFVSDLFGKIVLSGTTNSDGFVNVNTLNKGAYIFNVEKNGIIHSQKFIKQ